jgi:hypothetical protein
MAALDTMVCSYRKWLRREVGVWLQALHLGHRYWIDISVWEAHFNGLNNKMLADRILPDL